MKTIFRFKVGQTVWVRDRRRSRGGYKIVEAKVLDQHYHPGRHPWYPNGEGYDLDGELWWSCYPGLRVFATRAEAIAGRLPKTVTEAEHMARLLAPSRRDWDGFFHYHKDAQRILKLRKKEQRHTDCTFKIVKRIYSTDEAVL